MGCTQVRAGKEGEVLTDEAPANNWRGGGDEKKTHFLAVIELRAMIA